MSTEKARREPLETSPSSCCTPCSSGESLWCCSSHRLHQYHKPSAEDDQCRNCSPSLLLRVPTVKSLLFIFLVCHLNHVGEANSIVGLHVHPRTTLQADDHAPASLSQNVRSNEIQGTPVTSLKPDHYGLISSVNVQCNSNEIRITLLAPHTFNGMIYPKGLSKNSSCMSEYAGESNFTYLLPLRACNTMSTQVNDGVEYFNTVIVQPHRRLVTNQGRGYHIRCRYQTRDKRIANYNLNVTSLGSESKTESTPLFGTAPVPSSSMKIYMHGTTNEIVAENVKIGDRLTLSITIDEQDIYGMKITNCLVRDGLNWGEQPLINDEGCPVDKEIMGPFEYSHNLTRAFVSFHAHKFPYTSSVYYQCNVRLCLKERDGCDDSPPYCDGNNRNYRHTRSVPRHRRETYDAVVIPQNGPLAHPSLSSALASRLRQTGDRDMSMEVYSGLYVDESDNTNANDDDDSDSDDLSGSIRHSNSEEFCISMRKFAIGVAVASLILMLAVCLLVYCIAKRRKNRAHHHQRLFSSSGSTLGSASVYSGPYTNRAFSRD